MAQAVTEAHEPEDGRIYEAGFKRFVFEHAVDFRGCANPRFFDGARVANAG